MIKFSIINLDADGMEVKGSEAADILEIPDSEILSFEKPVEYDLAASLVNNGVLVKGAVRTTASARCARCAEKFDLPIENEEACIFVETTKASEIDITEQVREELLINMPQNWVCSEGCKGLCPHCGANLNKRKCKCRDERPDSGDTWKELDKLKLHLKK